MLTTRRRSLIKSALLVSSAYAAVPARAAQTFDFRSSSAGKAQRYPRLVLAGGQTGVDQSSQRAAMDSGILCAGWCPPGRICESGTIPSMFPLVETPVERSPDAPDVPRSLRTQWNARDSDATLILTPGSNYKTDPGTDWTSVAAKYYRKPVYMVDPYSASAKEAITDWIYINQIHVLNCAGPSEKTSPGISQRVTELMGEVFSV
ncbi:MAG: putative molybdenum carrier protein [Pseudomonadota bacterium]